MATATASSTPSSWKLPLLDMRQLDAPNGGDPSAFVKELRKACHTVGFFLLRHDIPPPVVRLALSETRQFFERPLNQKMQISYEQCPNFRGYMKLGVENTAGRLDSREQVEYAVEEPDDDNNEVDKSNDNDGALFYKRLKGQNPWPDAFQPSLKPAIMNVVSHMNSVADRLRGALCQALQLEASALDSLFASDTEPSHWVLKMVAYPLEAQDLGKDSHNGDADVDVVEDPPVLGVGAHTDTNFLTLILQDETTSTCADGQGGLQVYSQGQWRSVPLDMADSTVLICNLGEQAQVWSKNYLLATPHRVLLGRTANNNSKPSLVDRVSLPLFYNPRLSARIPSLPKPCVEALPWEREQDRHDWERSTPDTMLASVGENTFKSLARSHPAVFQRHHPDLTLLEDGRIVSASTKT